MNRRTNEQRLQIIGFYYQNACSVMKVHHAVFPIHGQFNRSTEAAIRAIVIIIVMIVIINFAPNLHCWTVNYQHNTLT